MAVVLAVGARLNGQASLGTRTFSTTSLCRAREDLGLPGQRDDFDGKPLERGQQIQQFLRFAGITQGQHHVAIIDNAQVAVQGVHAVEHHGGGTGAGAGGGDFGAHVAGFADAHHDQFAVPVQGGDDRLHGGIEGGIQLRADGFERGYFNVENFSGLGDMRHRRQLARNIAVIQPRRM